MADARAYGMVLRSCVILKDKAQALQVLVWMREDGIEPTQYIKRKMKIIEQMK